MLQQLRAVAQVKFLTDKNLGIYIHIPFCEKKCNYCDFYSAFYNEDMLKAYLYALKSEIEKWGGKTNRPIDTVYIGGGTPSLLGEHIIYLAKIIKSNFNLTDDCEFTVEVNPNSASDFLHYAKAAGVNRLSIGVQSGNGEMLKTLGRTHTAVEAASTVANAKKLGFNNISVDLMIALPSSNLTTLKKDVEFILSLDVPHISAYMLKIEPNTVFYKKYDTLNLPDDDQTAEHYLLMCEILKQNGYTHYEISNFAKGNYTSRHNMKYWTDCDYLGIGAAAHSYLDGKRFYYQNNLKKFIENPVICQEGSGGDNSERLMLGLRLNSGVNLADIYGDIPEKIKNKISRFEKSGYINSNLPYISLTDKGMLVSNGIIAELLLDS